MIEVVFFFREYPIFSSPGRSPGRAIVLPPVSALVLAAAAALAKCESFYVMGKECQASYPVPVTGLVKVFMVINQCIELSYSF